MFGRRLAPVGLALALLLAAAAGFLLLRRGGAARESPPRLPRLPGNPDVLLVTIDTLRADALGFAGNRRVETPTLDRLASQGLVFRNAHAHSVVTLPSHANILTGLLPYQHGIRDNTGFRLDRKIPTIASFLKTKGYATAAFVGAFPLDSRFGLSTGFDLYDDRYPRGKSALDFEMPERKAFEVVAAARRWWESQRGQRRFLWVHLYDCHAPYRPPSPFDERYRDNPYLGEVAGVDAALAPLLDPLLSGKSRPALILVTADHGEALGDHGEETHGLFAYEATLHVPLILWFPRAISAGGSSDSVRHVDIAPTVLAAAGIEKPSGWTGSSLLSPRDPRGPRGSYFEAYSAAFNRGWAPLRGVLEDGYKFIDLPLPELYDLKGDAAENRNLVSEKTAVLRRLVRELPPESALGASKRSQPGAEEVFQLRSLGYLSGAAPLKRAYTADDDPKNLITLDKELHDCVDLYQRGDLRGAIAIARKVVAERPGMSVAYENLGFLLRQSEPAAEALAVYRKAVESGIATEELKVHYGLALCEAGRAAEAVPLLKPLAESRDPDTVNALGIAYSDAGHAREAIASFERALALDPGNVEAYENLGVARLRSEDPAGAREMFRRALAFDERLARAWNGLGVALTRLGEEREALKCWRRAVELDSKLYDALFNLGLTAARSGLREEARQALRQFIATAPSASYRADIEKARHVLASLEGRPS